MKLIIMIFILVTVTIYSKDNGVIIANDEKILKIFRDSSESEIIEFANEVSESYNKVIMHLGSKTPFQRGSYFFYTTSQRNLKLFSDTLNKNGVLLYVWIFDSFGDQSFNAIYQSYQSYFDEIYSKLNILDVVYEGIVLDLEWINLGGGNNSEKLIEITKYIKDKIKSKKLFIFASLIEDEPENKKRGYDIKELIKYIDNVIVMLYIKDGGFYLSENNLLAKLNDIRVNSLIDYYEKKKFLVSVSLDCGLIINRNNNFYFIRTIKLEDVYNYNVSLLGESKNNYYNIYSFIANDNISMNRNDLVEEKIDKGEVFYYFESNQTLKEKSDFLWEFFSIESMCN